MNKTAFSYARVSTKEQEEKRNSIPEQLHRNKRYAMENNVQVVREFSDSDSAFHDENRKDFNEMINLAIIERPNYIIFDDSSRFARTKKVAIETKQLLRSYGIEIRYASEINIDNNTVAGFWLEGIQEIKNEATSREIAFHTKKGMTGNIQNRDIETGWCYKNGGKAPYGYKRTILYKGTNQKGKPIYKTIWELDEETYPIARKIIVDMYINQEMSYEQIRNYLNNNNIMNSNGKLWSTSTISSMLKEDRLEQYTGTAIWNKENNNVIGVKYNDKSLWIMCENAHPSVITKEEYQKAMERKNKTSSIKYSFKSESDYLLSGTNIENSFLFTCSECGGHVVGCSTGKKHLKKYSCGCNRYRGSNACSNNWKIEKDWLENRVLQIIEENYIVPNNIDDYINKVYMQVEKMKSTYNQDIIEVQKKINTIDKEIDNLLDSIKKGLDSDIAINEINQLKEKKIKEEKKIEEIKKIIDSKPKVSRNDIKEYFLNIQKLFYNSTIKEKRELLKTFISNISLNKKEHQLEISIYSQWCIPLEQVAGIVRYAPPKTHKIILSPPRK